MTYQIQVENIKCGGCANSISSKLAEIDGVEGIQVDVDAGMVNVEGSAETQSVVTESLLKMGYPESGSVEGIKAAAAKAKSFVSCAVGRMS